MLALRRACPALFAEGSYEPLEVRGAFADRVIAFARRLGDDMVVAIVPRAASQLLSSEQDILFDPAAWHDTCVATNGVGLTGVFRPSEAAGAFDQRRRVAQRFPGGAYGLARHCGKLLSLPAMLRRTQSRAVIRIAE